MKWRTSCDPQATRWWTNVNKQAPNSTIQVNKTPETWTMIAEKKWHMPTNMDFLTQLITKTRYIFQEEPDKPINSLAYTGDGGMGAREAQKCTSAGKTLPSKINVPPHSLSVSTKCRSELQETFPTCQQNKQHTSGNDCKLRPIFKLSSYN